MNTETVVITHTNDGIRFRWPSEPETVFANPIWLAEAYAKLRRAATRARLGIVEDVSKSLTAIEKALEQDASQETVEAQVAAVRDQLAVVVATIQPHA